MRFVGIDPSTKTGFAALGMNGEILKARELIGVGSKDPHRMATMIDEIMDFVHKDDLIVIEGFGYASMQAIQLGGIGWGIRMALHRRGFKYYEVAPNAVKKFVGVTGWTGEKGNKKRLTGQQKKREVMKAVFEQFGFEHKSDNVVDAFIMARIAREIWMEQNANWLLPNHQAEVIYSILNKEKEKSS